MFRAQPSGDPYNYYSCNIKYENTDYKLILELPRDSNLSDDEITRLENIITAFFKTHGKHVDFNKMVLEYYDLDFKWTPMGNLTVNDMYDTTSKVIKLQITNKNS